MLNFSFWIKIIQNRVSVALISGCEDDHIEVFAHIFDDFFGMGTDIYVSTDNLSLKRLEGYFDFVPFHHDLACVDQCLIHVKDDSFST